MTVEMEVRCRQCENCLKARAAHWRIRALAEYRAAEAAGGRNWFCTLTLSPAMRMHVLNECRRGPRKSKGYARLPNWVQGIDFDALGDDEKFRAKHAVISQEITKFVKRVRNNSGADIRLLCVVEEHKDGEPHYHLLIHEMRPEQPVRKHILKTAWTWGHSDFSLCKGKQAASYVCKYISKSSKARVRASLRYGESNTEQSDIENEVNEVNKVNVDNRPPNEGRRSENGTFSREQRRATPFLSNVSGLNSRDEGQALVLRKELSRGRLPGLGLSGRPREVSATATTAGGTCPACTCAQARWVSLPRTRPISKEEISSTRADESSP